MSLVQLCSFAVLLIVYVTFHSLLICKWETFLKWVNVQGLCFQSSCWWETEKKIILEVRYKKFFSKTMSGSLSQNSKNNKVCFNYWEVRMQVNYSLSKLWNDKVIIKYKFDNSVCKFSFLGCRFIPCVLYQRCSNSNQII